MKNGIKKLSAVALSAGMLLALGGCGDQKEVKSYHFDTNIHKEFVKLYDGANSKLKGEIKKIDTETNDAEGGKTMLNAIDYTRKGYDSSFTLDFDKKNENVKTITFSYTIDADALDQYAQLNANIINKMLAQAGYPENDSKAQELSNALQNLDDGQAMEVASDYIVGFKDAKINIKKTNIDGGKAYRFDMKMNKPGYEFLLRQFVYDNKTARAKANELFESKPEDAKKYLESEFKHFDIKYKEMQTKYFKK